MLFGRGRAPAGSAALGAWGERYAARYMRRRGWRVIARNVSCRGGEIDLIMVDAEGALVFLEVKTRRNEDFQPVEAVITAAKRRRMCRAARYFLRHHDSGDRSCRFDVVVVLARENHRPAVRHYPAAFRFA